MASAWKVKKAAQHRGEMSVCYAVRCSVADFYGAIDIPALKTACEKILTHF